MGRLRICVVSGFVVAGALVRLARASPVDGSSPVSTNVPDASAVVRDASPDGARAKRAIPDVDWMHIPAAKYQTSLVGYTPRVRVGNQRALGPAIPSYAQYLNAMHNDIHSFFADGFLTRLDTMRADDPLNDPKLVVRLEIGLNPRGEIESLGVVRSSGRLAFDLAALEAVTRAAPYEETPEATRSDDGRLYMHWEFYRDEVHACSTMNARPFRLIVLGDGGPQSQEYRL